MSASATNSTSRKRNPEARCGNCPYWNQEDTDVNRFCHRYPPSLEHPDGHEFYDGRVPISTHESSHCGEHPDFFLPETDHLTDYADNSATDVNYEHPDDLLLACGDLARRYCNAVGIDEIIIGKHGRKLADDKPRLTPEEQAVIDAAVEVATTNEVLGYWIILENMRNAVDALRASRKAQA